MSALHARIRLLARRIAPQHHRTSPPRARPWRAGPRRQTLALNTSSSAPWLPHLSGGSGGAASATVTKALAAHAPSPAPPVSNLNAANIVTAGRIAAAPVLAHCIIADRYDAALAVLLYAGASDWLDGVLARRFALHTILGSYLDPLADKLLVTSATLSLAYNHVLPPWLAVLVVSRDVALVAGTAFIVLRRDAGAGGVDSGADVRGRPSRDARVRAGAVCHHERQQQVHDRPRAQRPRRAELGLMADVRKIEPLFVSKVNTALQISLAVAAVVSAGDWGLVSADTVTVLGHATAVTTVTSGAMYARAFSKLRPRAS